MDRRPGQLDARSQHGFVNVMSVESLARERGNQGGMDVDHASGPGAAGLEGREEAEQGDEVHVVAVEKRVDDVVEGRDVGVLPARDRLPITDELLGLLRRPVTLRTVS